MDAARERFAERGCSILVVSQAKPETLAKFIERYNWHVPLVADPERASYAAMGLERTTFGTFFRPKVVGGYFRAMFKGHSVKRPNKEEDLLQLGGDFIIDRRCTVRYAYPSADPTDRPAIADLLKAVPPQARPS